MDYSIRMGRALCLLMLLTILGACGAGVKKDAQVIEEKPTLLATTQYIPVLEYDEKTASYLPYEPSENPYLSQKGRINKDAVTKFIEARRFFRAKKYDAAQNVLEEIVEIDKKLSGPLVMLGDIAVQKKDTEGAIAYYERAITVNAKNVNAYVRLAHAKRVLGEFLPAQNVYAEALAIWPDFPEAHLNLGILYDVYLNHPLRAQKHMEAYQFLTEGKNDDVTQWIKEVQSRTGVTSSFIEGKRVTEVKQ